MRQTTTLIFIIIFSLNIITQLNSIHLAKKIIVLSGRNGYINDLPYNDNTSFGEEYHGVDDYMKADYKEHNGNVGGVKGINNEQDQEVNLSTYEITDFPGNGSDIYTNDGNEYHPSVSTYSTKGGSGNGNVNEDKNGVVGSKVNYPVESPGTKPVTIDQFDNGNNVGDKTDNVSEGTNTDGVNNQNNNQQVATGVLSGDKLDNNSVTTEADYLTDGQNSGHNGGQNVSTGNNNQTGQNGQNGGQNVSTGNNNQGASNSNSNTQVNTSLDGLVSLQAHNNPHSQTPVINYLNPITVNNSNSGSSNTGQNNGTNNSNNQGVNSSSQSGTNISNNNQNGYVSSYATNENKVYGNTSGTTTDNTQNPVNVQLGANYQTNSNTGTSNTNSPAYKYEDPDSELFKGFPKRETTPETTESTIISNPGSLFTPISNSTITNTTSKSSSSYLNTNIIVLLLIILSLV